METLYVVYPEYWSDASIEGDALTFDFNNRMYLSLIDGIDPDKYFQANLLGGSVKFEVNLSSVGCGCVTAI